MLVLVILWLKLVMFRLDIGLVFRSDIGLVSSEGKSLFELVLVVRLLVLIGLGGGCE